MRIIARKEFTYSPPSGDRKLRAGYAATIPDEFFDAWAANGLCVAAPDVERAPIDWREARFHDEGGQIWLTWSDGESPKVPRLNALIAVTAWVTVNRGLEPEEVEAPLFMVWGFGILSNPPG